MAQSVNLYYPNPFYAYSPYYSACNTVLTPVAKALGTDNAILPLVLTTAGAAMKVELTGSIKMFQTINFTYFGANESFWYGSYQESNLNEGMILSDVPVMTSNATNMTLTPPSVNFPLIQRPGQQVNYGGFNQFRLYTKDSVAYVAYANIPLTLTSARAPVAINSLETGSSVQKSSALQKALAAVIAPLAAISVLFTML
ncbi:hypothetical protein HDV03_003532 [Kappamyces sp. JEL0829]|nr:hypothetical protein HDV03_003532 [Kappamyces sp. JEL0829]KAJ3345705.1 hypothetical protein HDU91_007262 [Kappamyces sp. JEL0680]